MTLYLDASVLIPLIVEEKSSPMVERMLREADGPLVVSEYAAAEAASGLSRLVRMGMLDAAEAGDALNDLDTWRIASVSSIDIEATDIRLAHLFVRRFETKLRVGDAIHLAACRRTDATLVTLDSGLACAAGIVGVACRAG